MHYIKKIFARELRKDATPEEKIVWEALRNRKYKSLKFRRQHVIEGFVVDFYCYEFNLAIEVDGGVHEMQKDYDELRQSLIEGKGVRFIRVSNEDINGDMQILFDRIDDVLDKALSINS